MPQQTLARLLAHLQIPWIVSSRPYNERRSAIDFILQPAFVLIIFVLSFTLVRALYASFLLPTYLLIAFCRSVLPALFQHGYKLFTSQGRVQLIEKGNSNASFRRQQAEDQLSGRYAFDRSARVALESSHPILDGILAAKWPANREYIDVCGLRACMVHEKPIGKARRSVVLLHGNPSWSFMYRHIIDSLLKDQLEVYALDWIGMGGSDKPIVVEENHFELHMQTLLKLFESCKLEDAYILAHDWGGCIALCTIPILPPGACTGLMLLNSFFPPSPSDISWDSYFLYLLWLSAQGCLPRLVPEQLVVRFMAPSVSASIAAGYAAPFQSIKSRAGIVRFARMVPGLPSVLYRLFHSQTGRLLDGLCESESFSSLHEQDRLRQRGIKTRQFWRSGKAQLSVSIVFGKNDTLLGDFLDVLCEGINTETGRPQTHCMRFGGHYAAEEQAHTICESFIQFAST